jgi:hypothetical protein
LSNTTTEETTVANAFELLLLGGAVGGLAWYIARPSKAAAGGGASLPPPAPPPPNPNEERIKALAVQVNAETQKQEALKAQVASLTAAAKAAPPAQKKQLEDAKAKLVAAASGTAQKTAALKNELAERAQAEQAAKKAAEAAAAKGPMYPVGLEATFGGKWVKIIQAWQEKAGGPWSYAIMAKLGMAFGLGDGKHTQTEAEIRSRIAGALGAMAPGQFYPAGLQVFRNGQGGLIEKVTKNADGTFSYQLRGWPNTVTQSELQGILTR